MTPEEEQILREQQQATRAYLRDFFLHLAILGYTGTIKAGHPVANTTAEMLQKFDSTKAWEALMAERGVDITKIPVEIKKIFIIQTEITLKAMIYGHGKLPGTIDEATAATVTP